LVAVAQQSASDRRAGAPHQGLGERRAGPLQGEMGVPQRHVAVRVPHLV